MKNKILFVQFDITKKCNFKCKHCYVGDKRYHEEDLSYNEIIKIVDNLCEPGIENIAFYGGEPLLREDIADIIEYCFSKKINTYIVTNGYLLDKKIKEIVAAGIMGIAVSAEGVTKKSYELIRGNDTFNQFKKNVQLLKEFKVKNRVLNFVLMKENLDEVGQVIKFAEELGLNQINFELLAVDGNALGSKYCTSLKPKEVIKAVENIAISIKSSIFPIENINISVIPPKIIEYINSKYSVKFNIGICTPHIPSNSIYIDNKGKVFPCKGVYPQFDYKNSLYKIDGFDLKENNAIQAIKSKDFLDWYINLNDQIIKNNSPYCARCKYLTSNCYPCPLSFYKSKKNIVENCIGYPIQEICREID